MSNLNNLNNKELQKSVEVAVKNERDSIIIVLRHLKEIESRRLHLDLGFKSLFEYCHIQLKYSRAESYARIASMRLMKDVKLVEEKIETGKLSLTHAVDLFASINKNERETGVKLSQAQKISLVEKIENCSTRESERVLEEELKVESVPNAVKTQNLKLDNKTFQDLKKLAKEMDIDDPLELIKLLIKEKSNEIKTLKNDKKIVKVEKTADTTTRYVPKQLKRDLLKEASYQCQYVAVDGRRCSAKTHLEVDHHIVPFCTGGRTIKSNLKIMCKQHNLKLSIDKLGINKSKLYLKY